MKKLYIPTTTLNFNNILSSESVSPKSFYSKRGFGYPRWESIPENDYDNVILLYESPRSFARPKSDYEDHPLLIEVSFREEDLSKFHLLREGVYCCDHTIYLTPWNTNFYFFSEVDKTVALSMSDSSVETKLLRLYSKHFQIKQFPLENYELITDSEHFNLNSLEIEKDVRINKMKGLLYGYYIGALLSTSLKSISRLNILREILNIFAAIISGLEKKPTDYQSERLDFLLNELQKTEPFYEGIHNIIDNVEKETQILSLIELEYGYLKDKIDKNCLLYDLMQDKEQAGLKNNSIKWIEDKIACQEKQIISKRKILTPDKSEIIVIDNYLSVISKDVIKDSMENSLYKSWVNDLFFDRKFNGKINSYKETFSDDITKKAGEIYQKKWESSFARNFLNDMRRYIRGDEFKHPWNNGLFSSITAVITHGEDWNKLLLFMQSKEMYDYRLAFSMYGVLNGFANLTRDFTDVIYSCTSEYLVEIYKEFHGQLFGYSPDEIKNEKQVNTSVDSLKQMSNEDFEKKQEGNTKEGDELTPSKSTEREEERKQEPFDVVCKLKNCNLNPEHLEDIRKIYSDNNFLINDLFFTNVKKLKRIGDKTLGKIKNALGYDNAQTNKQIEDNIYSKEKPQSGDLFYNDKNALMYLADILPNDKKVRNQFKYDVDWFQGNHNEIYINKKGNEQKGVYYKKPTDNQSVIGRFEKYLNNKQTSTDSEKDWLRKIYQKIDVPAIISKLKELYK